MRILITGSAGRVGGMVAGDLCTDHELVLADVREHERDPVARRGGTAEYHMVNVSNYEQLWPCFRDVETVFHLAGDPRTYAGWTSLLQNNINGTRNVYEAAARSGVRRIVYASSINVYPYTRLFRSDEHITADTPLESENPYGLSKIVCESIGLDYHRTRGMTVVNLRLGAVSSGWHWSWHMHEHFDPVGRAIRLVRRDLIEIVRACLTFEGYACLTCTSVNDGAFVDLTPIEKVLGVKLEPREDEPPPEHLRRRRGGRR
jgi:nucleoside-diphosphate-sugar epimerase